MTGAERLERLLTRIIAPLKAWERAPSVTVRRSDVQAVLRMAEEARQEAVALQGEPTRIHITADMRRQVLARANGLCAACFKPFTDADPPEIDHIIPVVRFGVTEVDNLQALHQSCNRQKSARKAG